MLTYFVFTFSYMRGVCFGVSMYIIASTIITLNSLIMCVITPSARIHFMADISLVYAHRNQEVCEFRAAVNCHCADHLYQISGFGSCFCAESLVCDDHQLFCINIQYHFYFGVLLCFITVVA